MESLLLEILNHPTDILALLDQQTLEIKRCNRNFQQYFSVKEDDCIGRFLYEVVGVNVSQEKRTFAIDQISNRQFFLEKEWLDDHQFYFSIARCDDQQCVVVRISSLRQNFVLEQYQQLFERNLAGVYKATIEGKIISCNKAFAHLMGYIHPEDLLGTDTIALYKDPSKRKSFLQGLRKESKVNNYEMEILRHDGIQITCLENAYLETTIDGREMISGTLVDISDKKRFEQELQESESRFRTIANVSGECVAFCKGEIVIDCNEQFARLFGYPKGHDVLGQKLSIFFTPHDIKRLRAHLASKVSDSLELRTFDRDGKVIFIELRGSDTIYKSEPTTVIVMRDITDRKKAEHSIEQSLLRLSNLIENSPNGIVILSDENIKYVNNAACRLLDVEDEDEVFGSNFLQFISPSVKKIIKRDLQDIRNGVEVEYREIQLVSSAGRVIDVGIKNTLTVYENKPSVQVTLNNISDRKQLVQEQVRIRLIEEINTVLKTEIEDHKKTQNQLKEQQRVAEEQKAKLESIINSTENIMMWTMDKKRRLTLMNQNFAKWLEEQCEERIALGENVFEVLTRHVHPDFYQGQLSAFDNAFKGRPQQVEIPLMSVKGEPIWLQAFLNPVRMDDDLEEISCLVYDNTERRQIERLVRDALKEKEVLLQEVHHRVKNNLQIISSILSLQSGYVTDPATQNILQESRERIKSMSFIHETLYRTSDFSKLEFTPYLTTIVGNLVQSYRTPGLHVEFVPELDDVYLSLDQSIPCGLIVNELVSNAMKYAWKGKSKGRLHVVLREPDPGEIELIIEDDGVGLPKTFLFDKTDSLGIQLVYTLIEQLDAKLDVASTKKGTTFSIHFKRA